MPATIDEYIGASPKDVQSILKKIRLTIRKAAPQADGRLCAVAEALLGWDEKEPLPEPLTSFLAQHFGLLQTVPRVTVATLETDKPENVTFYRKFGFETVDEITVLGMRTWFMRRAPGPATSA